MSSITKDTRLTLERASTLSSSYKQLFISTRRLALGLHHDEENPDVVPDELIHAQATVLCRNVHRADDAITQVRIAAEALEIIDGKLERMKALAEESASSGCDSVLRQRLDAEYQVIASDIARVAVDADFASLGLPEQEVLSQAGVGGRATAQVLPGAEGGQVAMIVTADALGLGAGASGPGRTIATQSAAQAAMPAVHRAIDFKNRIRAGVDVLRQHLEATVSALRVQAENLSSAESRISDADIALEMSQFVRTQILVQSGVSALTQPNPAPRMALALLG